ncbi:CDP-alcohol phosphatidyltransferase family protein [Roseibium sp. RKSG952]|uniref:CDP-alcohol phosphatidyltransferase family protein n=1 Tax=Roseibium sp. RKSG952 TaxID=2529384 RepID=UPI0012BBEC42|nr:CDP-alcohol phosphatidyltransferase family protein [Roseibium sp. RKSG952]MTI00239.1 CDP-alcohol phosphatidyltransferase family protein [Roseibium sp. RKSG952]
MFDAKVRPLIDPPLNALGRLLASRGISANAVTIAGFVIGLAAAVAVAFEATIVSLILIGLNRIADGLDGAVARASGKSDLGGYLDIVLDFFFYGSIPFAFALHNPEANALAASALLLSFYANGSAFLSFAIMAEKRGLSTARQGSKSLYYLGGLAEGTETIAVFVLMCLWPSAFAVIAWIFAAVCFVSAGARVLISAQVLRFNAETSED